MNREVCGNRNQGQMFVKYSSCGKATLWDGTHSVQKLSMCAVGEILWHGMKFKEETESL
jgi:hypothetical protein